MENVILIVHLILALCLIGIVLLQRSEGGGLGFGGGAGVMTGRAAATALGKITWIFAAAFFITSMLLTIFAASSSGGRSVVDRLTGTPPAAEAPAPATDLAPAGDLLPPAPAANAPLVPKAAD